MNKKLACIAMLCIMTFCLLMTGCGKSGNADISNDVIAQFEEFTEIPRPSTHEEKISAYLKKWAEERDYPVVRDKANNIIFEVPATEGYENLPKVALRCHMDMVFASKEGLELDPLTTVVKTENDGTYLKSDGNTSIGADDGIGLSIVLNAADGKMNHGPLRVIVTTDEEDGGTGAKELDVKHYDDIDYLINVDSETEGEVTVSTASSDSALFAKKYQAVSRTKAKGYEISIKGLAGGHSGIDIDKGRLNGGIAIGSILDAIQKSGIDFELQQMEGGTAGNAIISSAKACIFIDEGDREKVENIVSSCGEKLEKEYGKAEPDMELAVSEYDVQGNDMVLPEQEKKNAITFITGIKNGINTMSSEMEGLVESSSNLGKINIGPDELSAFATARSSSEAREKEILKSHRSIGDKLGYDVSVERECYAWEYRKDNKLEKAVCDSYKELFGTDMKVVAVHAGLECGKFASGNKNLNMVSIGPTVLDPHTVNERVEIASIQKLWDLLENVLENIS